ncbi:hypothetical protein [Parasitella parasitica]|uniref:Uncharacterized protein n=1 Tax=Parasitella parasitica TaxID=35722 RepID=A0A0B7N2G0_9FUNG|nr:hypothetical protein [Parasitella parasitica]
MSEKQFIQENVPQQTATPGYVYRNLKAIDGVAKVNLESFNSLKGAVLIAINSNRPLQIKTFIAATQKEIQDKTFKVMKFTDSRGSRMFSPLQLYDCKAKSIQIDQQAFWKIFNTCGKTNQ